MTEAEKTIPLGERALGAVARFACYRYKLVLAIAVFLTLLAPLPMFLRGYTTAFNVAKMLPQDIPASRAFTRAITDFGTADEAIVVFRLNPDSPRAIEIAGGLADRIAARVIQNPDVASAFSQLLTKEEKDQLLNVELPRHGMLLLPKEDIEAVRAKLTTERIRKSVENVERRLASDTLSENLKEQVLMNALGIGTIFQDSFKNLLKKDLDQPATGEKKLDTKGYLVSPRGEMLLLVIEPKYPAQSIPFSARIMGFIEQSTYDCMLGAAPITADCCTDWMKFFSVLKDSAPSAQPLFQLLSKPDKQLLYEYLKTGDAVGLNHALTVLNKLLRNEEAAQILATTPESKAELDRLQKEVEGLAAIGLSADKVRASLLIRFNANHLARANTWAGFKAPQGGAELPMAALQTFKTEFAGGYQIARRYGEKINGVVLGTLLTSALSVLAFFGYCFRRYGVLLYIGIPLFMVISWTAGIGWMLFGQLNLVSCAFAAVLVGLGIDYSVHIYNRYIEERARGCEVERAFELSMRHTGWGVIIGMATTCFAFFALNATRFTQLAEFGFLGAIGIFLSAPAMMLVMPALITWRARRGGEKTRVFQPVEFGLPKIARFVFIRRRLVCCGAVVLALLSIGLLAVPGSVIFNSSMSALRPSDRAFEINGEISDAFASRNPNKFTFMVLGDTEEDALVKMAAYEEKLKQLQKDGLIRGYESVTSYLPSPQEQRQRLEVLRTIDFDRALADFRAVIKERGGDESYFKFNIDLLTQHAKLVKEGKIILPADFRGTKISRLVNRYVARRQQEYNISGGEFPARYPVTLAKAATQYEDNLLRYPAETVLTEESVRGLNPPGQDLRLRVKSITVYEGGYAVKATVFPPVLENGRDGEPHITREWLDKVSSVLGLDPAQFIAKPDLRDFPATLTGVAVTSAILAEIVQEDFFHISIWIGVICFCIINCFYHKNPLRAALCTLPALFFFGYFKQFCAIFPHVQENLSYYAAACALLLFFGGLFHKRILLTICCFIPIGLGLLFLGGVMAGLNLLAQALGWHRPLDMNFINVLTIPIIIGVGVDNGIHLVNRFFECGRRTKPLVVEVGRALTITALTSVGGFGSLYTSKFQGFESIAQLGVLTTVALMTLLFASVVCFPAIISTIFRGGRKRHSAFGKR